MNYVDLKGQWKNEFNSVMTITDVNPKTGIFSGTYSSTTGATGTYWVTGVTDTHPAADVNSQTVSFSISWRDIDNQPITGENWVSAFAGQLQINADGKQVLQTTYLLQKNTPQADDWEATAVAVANFQRVPSLPQVESAAHVEFALKRGALSDNGATPWTASVGLGTAPQHLRFMLDSGTTNTWITASQCTSNACLKHQRFDSARSDSFKLVDSKPQVVDFGPWGSMTVLIGSDKFTLEHSDGGNKHRVQTKEPMRFQTAVHYTGYQFEQLDSDGGIAIPSPYWQAETGNGDTEALMLQLLKDGKIAYPLAAFSCDPHSGHGSCTFGAVDPGQYQANTLQWLSLQDASSTGLGYLWSVTLSQFLVNDQAVSAGIDYFVLDSGSSYFKGPADLIQTLVNAVTDNGRLPTYVSSHEALKHYPKVALALGNQSYVLSPEQYFLKLNDEYWELGIEVLDGMPENMLLVGSLFLETLYCIFDYGGMQVGLAQRHS